MLVIYHTRFEADTLEKLCARADNNELMADNVLTELCTTVGLGVEDISMMLSLDAKGWQTQVLPELRKRLEQKHGK